MYIVVRGKWNIIKYKWYYTAKIVAFVTSLIKNSRFGTIKVC